MSSNPPNQSFTLGFPPDPPAAADRNPYDDTERKEDETLGQEGVELFHEFIRLEACASSPDASQGGSGMGFTDPLLFDPFFAEAYKNNDYTFDVGISTRAQMAYRVYPPHTEDPFAAMESSFISLLSSSSILAEDSPADFSSPSDCDLSFCHAGCLHAEYTFGVQACFIEHHAPATSIPPTTSSPPIRAQLRLRRAYSPNPSPSPTILSRSSSWASLSSRLPSFRPRVRQVPLGEYKAAREALKGCRCPFCDYVQRNNRRPEF